MTEFFVIDEFGNLSRCRRSGFDYVGQSFVLHIDLSIRPKGDRIHLPPPLIEFIIQTMRYLKTGGCSKKAKRPTSLAPFMGRVHCEPEKICSYL